MCSLPDTAVFLVTEHLYRLAFRTPSLHFSATVRTICVRHFQAHSPTFVLTDNNTLTVVKLFYSLRAPYESCSL